MSNEQALDLIILLSAIESWGMSSRQMMPDYLVESLDSNIEALRNQVLGKDLENESQKTNRRT